MVDYVFYTMQRSSNEHEHLKQWLPLGHTYETPMPAPSHIIPASRRSQFCSFQGSSRSNPVRMEIARAIGQQQIHCSVNMTKSDPLEYRKSLLESAILLAPMGVHEDTVYICSPPANCCNTFLQSFVCGNRLMLEQFPLQWRMNISSRGFLPIIR